MANIWVWLAEIIVATILGAIGVFLYYTIYSWFSNRRIRNKIPIDFSPEDAKDTRDTLAYPGKDEKNNKEVQLRNERRDTQHRTFEKLRRIAEGDGSFEEFSPKPYIRENVSGREQIPIGDSGFYSRANIPARIDEQQSRPNRKRPERR